MTWLGEHEATRIAVKAYFKFVCGTQSVLPFSNSGGYQPLNYFKCFPTPLATSSLAATDSSSLAVWSLTQTGSNFYPTLKN